MKLTMHFMIMLLICGYSLASSAATGNFSIENIHYSVIGNIPDRHISEFHVIFSHALDEATEDYDLVKKDMDVILFEKAKEMNRIVKGRYRSAGGFDPLTGRFMFLSGFIFKNKDVAASVIRHEIAHYAVSALMKRFKAGEDSEESIVLSELFAQTCEPLMARGTPSYPKTYGEFIAINYKHQISVSPEKTRLSDMALAGFGSFLRKTYSIKQLAFIVADPQKRNVLSKEYDSFLLRISP